MKTNKLNWMAVVLLPLMLLCTACNDEEVNDEEVNDEQVTNGGITCKMRNNDNGSVGFIMCKSEIEIDVANNFYSNYYSNMQYGDGYSWQYGDGEFVDMGTKHISEIKNIPTQGWASKVAVFPGHGYIFRTKPELYIAGIQKDELNKYLEEYLEKYYWYGYIYVVDYIKSTPYGGIIGAEVKYKESSEPELELDFTY